MDTTASSKASVRSDWSPPLPDAPGFTHTVVETPGLRTHVAAIGEGEPVIMLHGFPQHWWEWRRVAPLIAARGFRVICPDLRLFGWSEADEPRLGRMTMMHDLVAVLDALGVENAHVVSHDLGSVVAGQLAYAHPERVRTAVQFAVPPGFMTFSPKLLPAFSHLPPLLTHRDGRLLDWLFTPHYAYAPMTHDIVDGYLRVQQRPGFDAAVRELYRGMIIPEVMRLATGHYKRRRLHPPTLAVFGRHDGPFTEPTVRMVCRGHERYADRFDLAFIDDAAHFVIDDAPDAVADLVLEWFAREAPSSEKGASIRPAETIALRVQRELPGTPEEVFDAYTDPQQQRRWLSALGPEEGEVQPTVDLRVGGRWEATFRPNPQTLVHDVQTYREVDRPRRLVTDLVGESNVGGQRMPPIETHIAMTFEATDAGTLVTVEQSGFSAAEMRDFFENVAWPGGLGRLGAFVASARRA